MGKHDQRILKFLNQNADRAPTITDMMTRLNISISEISTSLNTLLDQGLVAKKTNNQGIECWFPANSPMAIGAGNAREVASPALVSALASGTIATTSAPPAPKPGSSVEVLSPSALGKSPEMSLSNPNSYAPPLSMASLTPPAKGVGFVTFLLGLVAMGGLAAWGGAKLSQANLQIATKTMVDQKTFHEAINSWTEFETRTQAQLKAMDDQVKSLTQSLDSSKAAVLAGAGAPGKPLQAAQGSDAKPASKKARGKRARY